MNSTPTYAGYVLWRGNFGVEQLSDRDAWQEVCDTNEWITIAFDGRHGVMYPIPGASPSSDHSTARSSTSGAATK